MIIKYIAICFHWNSSVANFASPSITNFIHISSIYRFISSRTKTRWLYCQRSSVVKIKSNKPIENISKCLESLKLRFSFVSFQSLTYVTVICCICLLLERKYPFLPNRHDQLQAISCLNWTQRVHGSPKYWNVYKNSHQRNISPT